MKSRGLKASLRLVPVFLSVLAGLTAAESATAVAAPAPAWRISQQTLPTRLVPGTSNTPRYSAIVWNVGGAVAEDITVTDTLPSGLAPSPGRPPQWRITGAAEECEVTGQTITCHVSPVEPGHNFELVFPLEVPDSAPATVENELVVESASAPTASDRLVTSISSEHAPFEFLSPHGFAASVSDEAGNAPFAGAHPFAAIFNVEASNREGGGITYPVEGLRSVQNTLPHGLVVNPQGTSVRCTLQELSGGVREPHRLCPPESQVGSTIFHLPGLGWLGSPIYNMVPPPGVPAELAFEIENTIIVIDGKLSGGFDLVAESTDLLTKFFTSQISVELWGDPSDSRHDSTRYGQGCEDGCPINPAPAPFLSMPTSCTELPNLTGTIVSWRGTEDTRNVPLTDRNFEAIELNGCNALAFEPTIESKATTNLADSPSGLDFSIHQKQDLSLDGRSTAPLKDTTVTLPEGMTLNASAAAGLDACTAAQMGYAPVGSKVQFNTTPQHCPDASKLGTVEVTTPLLDHPLPGSIYLAKPYDNPFGSLTSIYLAIEDEQSGIVAKLAGKVTPDPATGQLTSRFTESPELPVEDIDLHFFKGANAALKTPISCGTKTTTSTLTPWSTPEGADVHPSDSFVTTTAAAGSGACPSSEADAPNTPSFSAGTVAPAAGAFSPFVLKLSRADGTQQITGLETALPPGLTGKLAGIPYCSEAQIAKARSREAPNQGVIEQNDPSCPSASQVGSVTVGAGAGPNPLYTGGNAYLAGPYEGAPLSMAVIVPAVAGPFDLGTVVTRVALHVGTYSAQINAVSDPLPKIIDGIPLDVRSISLRLDRPNFSLNPTSCEVMAITAKTTSPTGQSANLDNRFQVGGCQKLGFKPKFSISLKGATKRSGHPALKAVLTMPKKGNFANIAKVQVSLPHSEFLDQSHIGTVCTQAQLASQTCPKKSIYGKVRAISPLLDGPLAGPVYLGVGFGHELPDVVADLNGQVRVLAHGKVDTNKEKGIRTTFEAVPDAPVSKFILEMQGDKKGLLQNSENICRAAQRADATFTAQNGKVVRLRPTIQVKGCGPKQKKAGKGSKKPPQR
jgi:uncharacterized repeat protein (TIGR01451 family)